MNGTPAGRMGRPQEIAHARSTSPVTIRLRHGIVLDVEAVAPRGRHRPTSPEASRQPAKTSGRWPQLVPPQGRGADWCRTQVIDTTDSATGPLDQPLHLPRPIAVARNLEGRLRDQRRRQGRGVMRSLPFLVYPDPSLTVIVHGWWALAAATPSARRSTFCPDAQQCGHWASASWVSRLSTKPLGVRRARG